MFQNLTQRLTQTIQKIRGGRLTEDNIQSMLREVRVALLESDVALSVIEKFIRDIKDKALGQTITKHVRPGEALVKIVQDELQAILGKEQAPLILKAAKPLVIVMVGLQGSGKTTSVAKLALWLKEHHKKSVMLASTDIYRPAAIEQLEILAQQVEVDYFPAPADSSPDKIAQASLRAAEQKMSDILILDTAGRLHIDNNLMSELSTIISMTHPTETLLVVDSMTGQDAANIAQSFNTAIPLTGIILTKTDGDARGGAALSMRVMTGKPIKFIGTGEKISDFSIFYPDRTASRILGMGDIVSLVEAAQHKISEKETKSIKKKLKTGSRFDFNDFWQQLKQMKQMGGIKSLLDKLPQVGKLPKGAAGLAQEEDTNTMIVIIQSMTLKERQFPALLNGSRKRRIASGSGQSMQEINKMVKKFNQMQKMMKRMSGNKMEKRLKQMQDMNIDPSSPSDWRNLK